MTLPATTFVTNPKPDRLTSCHMAGWLAAYCTKCQPDPPQGDTCCGHVCDYFGHKDLWSDVLPPVEASSGQEQYHTRSA